MCNGHPSGSSTWLIVTEEWRRHQGEYGYSSLSTDRQIRSYTHMHTGAYTAITFRVLRFARQPQCQWLADGVMTTELNELWLAGSTEHRTMEEGLYVCAIKMISNGITGCAIDSRTRSCVAVNALSQAVARHGHIDSCIALSNRGSRLRSRKNIRELSSHGVIGSMSRLRVAGNSADIDTLFALLRNNVLDKRTWNNYQELRIAIVIRIDWICSRSRRQDTVGQLPARHF